MSEIICECGHGIEIHDLVGCNFPRPYAPNDCMCELSPEAVEARHERDALRKQLEIVDKYLIYFSNVDWGNSSFLQVRELAIEARSKISKIGGKNVQG